MAESKQKSSQPAAGSGSGSGGGLSGARHGQRDEDEKGAAAKGLGRCSDDNGSALPAAAAAATVDLDSREGVREKLDALVDRVKGLRKRTAEATLFLTVYDLRRAQEVNFLEFFRVACIAGYLLFLQARRWERLQLLGG